MSKRRLTLFIALLVLGGQQRLPAAERVAEMENKIVGLTNSFRKSHRKPALKLNAQLSQAAQQHALNMAAQETMAHELDGKTYLDRVQAAGYTGKMSGENVATAFGKPDNAEVMVKSWKESEPHRENMLGVKYKFTEFGVGVAVSATGKYYACQVFGAPGPPGKK